MAIVLCGCEPSFEEDKLFYLPWRALQNLADYLSSKLVETSEHVLAEGLPISVAVAGRSND